MRKKVIFLLALILTAFSALLLSGSASAASVPNNVKYKAAYEGVYQCLSNGAYQEIFMASKGGAGMLKTALGGEMVKLPYGLTDASDNNTNCKEILKGFNDNARSDDNLRAGLLKAGIWSEKDQTVIKNYFAGPNGNGGAGSMGYEAIRAGNVENEQTTSKLTIALDTSKLNNETCRKKSGSTTIIGTQSFYDDQGSTYSQLTFPTITKDNTGNWFFGDVASNSSGINVPKPGSGDVSLYYFCNDDSWIQIADSGSANSPYYSINVVFTSYYMDAWGSLADSSAGIQSELATASGGGGWDYTANTGLFKGTVTEGKVEETGDFEDYELRYLSNGTLDQAKATMMRTLAKLSATNAAGYNFSLGSSSTYDALKLTDGEIYSLYTYYVKDVFKYPVLCEGDAAFSSYNDSNSKKINWVSGKTCRIDTAAAAASPAYSVYGINNSTKHFTEKVTIDDVVNALNALPDDISGKVDDGETGGTIPGGSADNGTTTDNDVGDGNSVSNCIDAAGPLGWIICPTLYMVGEATEKLYDIIEDNFLWIGKDVMGAETETGEETEIHVAWRTFRDYANVIFIIVFLVVILSQITGIGISNYGIKKVLPRLIAVALLTNLSFIICQLAVDLSDIVGSGLNTALASLQVGNIVDADGNIVGTKYGVNKIISDIFGVLFASAGTVGVGYLAAVTWEIWLLPLLLAIIGALVGVFVFFLSLAVREAGIIILVVLCPVAIICYALPNTKKLFDKWFKIFTSLLMVYPICGFLMGGGQLASSLLVNSASNGNPKFMLTLTAMLLSVVPFFFIPTIVRTSLNAIGQLGARLSNFGRGMSGRLTGAIRGSERFKDAQRELSAKYDEAAVRRLDRKAGRLAAKGKELSSGAKRRRLRAYMRADKAFREDLLGRAYEGRDLLRDDDARQQQLLGNIAAKDFDERVAGAKAAYRDNPAMATEDAIVAEHSRLLDEFGNNPNDIRLQSQLRALEEMAMEKGALGQDLLQQSFARYMTKNKNSWNDNKGLAMSKLGAGMATRYGKELNSSDKGFNAMMNHFAEKKFKLDSFSGDDTSGYSSSYDTKLAGFTAAGMGKATPGALQRGLAALQSGGFSSNDPRDNAELIAQAQTLANNATQALNDELIANDIKPKEKGFVQGIAAYGASMPGNSAIITGLGQGSLENLSQFVDSTNDTTALMNLGKNMQDAANSSHLYGEAETKRIKMIINKINSKAGTSYTFNPASMQIDQSSNGPSGQQDIPEMFRVSDAERAQLEADAAKNGHRIR